MLVGTLGGMLPMSAVLPIQTSSFVGRDAETTAVLEALSVASLVTLVGPGGCGKTRLALHVVPRIADRFSSGVRFVELSSVADPARVPAAIADAIGAQDAG